MDGRRFDLVTKVVTRAPASRRGALRGVVAAVAALMLGRAGASAGCAKLGKRCGRGARCCGGARCKGGTCRCGGGRTRCGDRCIPTADYCTSDQCGGALCQDGRCVCSPGQRFCHGVCRAVTTCESAAFCGAGEICCGGVCGNVAGRTCACEAECCGERTRCENGACCDPPGSPCPRVGDVNDCCGGRCENAVCR